MSSPAEQHIRFVDPLPSPPANRPRRPGLKYPSVAQRKDIPDRLASPDLAWPGPRPLSRINLPLTPLFMPTECPPTEVPLHGSWDGYTTPEFERTLEELSVSRSRWGDEDPVPKTPERLGKPSRTPSMSFSDSLRGLFNFARDSFMSISPSPSKQSLDGDCSERPRLFLHCNASVNSSGTPESSSPSSTMCESSGSSAGNSLTSTPAGEIRKTWLEEGASSHVLAGIHT